jgi:hypothetical protein
MSRAALSVLCLSLLATAGCDPGFLYSPINAQGKIADTWSETINGVHFEDGHFMTLVGEQGAFRELDVTNNSTVDVVVLGATLESKGRTLRGEIAGDDPKYWTIHPGSSAKVFAKWDFDGNGGDAEAVFGGAQITWSWNVCIGEEEHTLVVNMRKT